MTVRAATRAAPLVVDVGAARMAFSTRATGDMSLRTGTPRVDVLAARERLARALGLHAGEVVFAEQVHGAHVAVVGRRDRGRGVFAAGDAIPGADALVTTEEGVGLAVLAADCVPVLLTAPDAVAAVHAGRRGVTRGVVAAALETLARLGVAPAQVEATLGPAIGGCCYEVPAGLAREVSATVPAAGTRTTWGAPSLDLPAAVSDQLRSAGVRQQRRVGGCTRCGDGMWFSARAANAGAGPAGRHAGVVMRLNRSARGGT